MKRVFNFEPFRTSIDDSSIPERARLVCLVVRGVDDSACANEKQRVAPSELLWVCAQRAEWSAGVQRRAQTDRLNCRRSCGAHLLTRNAHIGAARCNQLAKSLLLYTF